MKTKVRPKKLQSQLSSYFPTQRSSSNSPVKRKVKQEPNGSQDNQREKTNKTQPEPRSKRFKVNNPVNPEAATSNIPGTSKKATSTNKNQGNSKKATNKNYQIWLSKLEYAEINDVVEEKMESLNKEIEASTEKVKYWKEKRERCVLMREREKFLKDREELQTQLEEDYKQRTPKRFQINHLKNRKRVNKANKNLNFLLSQDLFSDDQLDCSMEDLDDNLMGKLDDPFEVNKNSTRISSKNHDYSLEELSHLVFDEPFETVRNKNNKSSASKNHVLDYSLEELSALISTPFENKKKELIKHAETSKQQFLKKRTQEQLEKKRGLEERLVKAKVELIAARRDYEEFVRDNST